MMKHFILNIVFAILVACSLFFLQGCSCFFGYAEDVRQPEQVYKYQLVLFDTTNQFKQVIYSNSSLIDTSTRNSIIWELLIHTPQTSMYIETTKGWDTVVYEITKSNPVVGNDHCGNEENYIFINEPVIVSHTFDTVYKTVRQEYGSNNYDPQEITITSLILKEK